MLNINDTLYFSSLGSTYYTKNLWQNVLDRVPFDGQWYFKISDKVMPNRMVTRNGVWTTPWPQELIPKFAMPAYDPSFNKSFEEVTDTKAIKIRDRIRAGEQFAVMYSGGIDSTLILAALIRNLSTEELQNVTVMCSGDSMIENPTFYRKFIHNKLKTLDSKKYKYDDMINMNLTPITGDEGDCIFGTLIGLNMYNNFNALIENVSGPVKINLLSLRSKISDPETHYSNFKELIIQYLNSAWHPDFGRILYEKYNHNVETATVPVHSLHDFFWWLIFNVKYLNCSVRGPLYFNDTIDPKTAIERTENWFNDEEYQLWSMVNNNNNTKIKNTILSYKGVAKDYIYSVDQNEWYRTFKTKLTSLWNITNLQDVSGVPEARRPAYRIGLKKDDWSLVHVNDPGVEEYFVHHLSNYKIDWTDL